MKRFWKVQYVKYPIDYNLEAVRTLVRRAMQMGFYEGVNLSLSYCDDCGHGCIQDLTGRRCRNFRLSA